MKNKIVKDMLIFIVFLFMLFKDDDSFKVTGKGVLLLFTNIFFDMYILFLLLIFAVL